MLGRAFAYIWQYKSKEEQSNKRYQHGGVLLENTTEMVGVFGILLWTKEAPKGVPRAVLLCFYGKTVKKTM